MKLILGIGNPGKGYYKTRHNAGLLFVQWLVSKKYNASIQKQTQRYIQYNIEHQKFVYMSLTYMNLSGKVIQSIKRKHPSLKSTDIIVAHDDLEHKIGNVRIKQGGSAQGHNGIQSIAAALKTKDILKLQFGIGRPQSRDPEIVSKYVLSKFSKEQEQLLNNSFKKGVELAKQYQFL